MTRVDVHDYLDYRKFLREALAFEKSEGRISGHRDVATFLGLKSPGHITWILQGKRDLMERLVPRMVLLLRLTQQEATYFALLVEHNDTTIPEERRRLMARLSRLQSERKKLLTSGSVSYWSAWHHAVIRELVAMGAFTRDDTAAIGAMLTPAVPAAEVASSLDLLEELDLISRGDSGVYRRTDSILTTGENWSVEAIRNFQNAILELSRRALHEIPRADREISTITFSLSEERFLKVRARIQEMRQEILTLVRTDPSPDTVYHLAIQLFPASVRSGVAHA